MAFEKAQTPNHKSAFHLKPFIWLLIFRRSRSFINVYFNLTTSLQWEIHEGRPTSLAEEGGKMQKIRIGTGKHLSD